MPDDIQEAARRLQESLNEALAANENLKSEREALIARAKEAEGRSLEAEAKVVEIEDKITVLETLRSESYQKAVTELFEVPSKKSARFTVIFATLSIAMTVTVALLTTMYSRTENAEVVDRLASALEEKFPSPGKAETPEGKEEPGTEVNEALTDPDVSDEPGSTSNLQALDLPYYQISSRMRSVMYEHRYDGSHRLFIDYYAFLLEEFADEIIRVAKNNSEVLFTVVAYADRNKSSRRNCTDNARVSRDRAKMFTQALRRHVPGVSPFLANDGRQRVCAPPPGVEDPESPEARRIALVLGDIQDCGCPYKEL